MQNRATKVSMAVIRRLPKVNRYLEGLLHREIFWISSKELAESWDLQPLKLDRFKLLWGFWTAGIWQCGRTLQ